MTAVERARKLIEDRLAEIEGEAAALRDALSSLEGPAGDGRSVARRSTRTRRGRRRAGRGQRQEQFLAALKGRPGAPMAEIAQEMGVAPQQLYPIARRLADAGRIAKRRGGGYKVAEDGDSASAKAREATPA